MEENEGWQRVFIQKAESEMAMSRPADDVTTASEEERHRRTQTAEELGAAGTRRRRRCSGASTAPKPAVETAASGRSFGGEKTVETLFARRKFNVLMVADVLRNDEYDRRFVDACIVLCREGHNVTVLSTRVLTGQCFEIRHYCRRIHEVGRWLPRDLCGAAFDLCHYLRSAYMALWAYLHVRPAPDLIVCSCVSLAAMRLFRWMRGSRLLALFQAYNRHQLPSASPEHSIRPRCEGRPDASFVDGVLCSNLLTKCVFEYAYVARDVPVTVLYPTVRTLAPDRTPPPPALPIADRSPRIFLAVYNLVPESRFDMAIEAFGRMYGAVGRPTRDRCYLVLVGRRESGKGGCCGGGGGGVVAYRRSLRNRIRCMNMCDRIFVLGDVPVRGLVRSCFAYVHAQPRAVCEDNIIEALAAGRPVIAVNSGFPCEVLKHKRTGYLLPPDADLFADAMTDLLLDATLYRAMCARARTLYEDNFSWSCFERGVCRAVERLCSADPSAVAADARRRPERSKTAQDVVDLDNALEEIHRWHQDLPCINVLATHQELITDRYYCVEKLYADALATPRFSSHSDVVTC